MALIDGYKPSRPVSSVARDNVATTAIYQDVTGNDKVVFIGGLLASYSAAVAAVKAITFYRGPAALTGLVSAPTLSRGSTDRNVASTAFEQTVLGVQSLIAAVAAGTALAAGTIPINTWGVYRLLTKQADGSLSVIAGAANFTTGYADEPTAKAAVPAAPAGYTASGYLTVQTKTGTTFVGGTDGLTGGASGNVANATNYYQDTAGAMPANSWFTLNWDFSKTTLCAPLPADLEGYPGEAIAAVLAASGTGGITGQVTLFGRVSN